MGSIIKTLIFIAILVVAYFAFIGFYQNKNDLSSEVKNTEQNVDDAINNTSRELQNDIIQTANQIQNETGDEIIAAESSLENTLK